MAEKLQGRRALVTGAASGIGRAIAMRFVAEGAEVVGLDLSAGDGRGFAIVSANVCSEIEIEAGIARAVDRLGGLDILVNCAGIEIPARLADVATADIDRTIAVNLRGPILVARAALSHLGEGSRIINVASELAYLGRAGSSVYAATKGAILSLTRSWARELAPKTAVNAIAPGPVDTPLLNFANLTAEQRSLELVNPMRRIGAPEEIAAAAAFLASDEASFITGQCISVDGGAAMH